VAGRAGALREPLHNQCLPSYVGGDAYRVYWLYREGNPLATAVRGVLIDA